MFTMLDRGVLHVKYDHFRETGRKQNGRHAHQPSAVHHVSAHDTFHAGTGLIQYHRQHLCRPARGNRAGGRIARISRTELNYRGIYRHRRWRQRASVPLSGREEPEKCQSGGCQRTLCFLPKLSAVRRLRHLFCQNLFYGSDLQSGDHPAGYHLLIDLLHLFLWYLFRDCTGTDHAVHRAHDL